MTSQRLEIDSNHRSDVYTSILITPSNIHAVAAWLGAEVKRTRTKTVEEGYKVGAALVIVTRNKNGYYAGQIGEYAMRGANGDIFFRNAKDYREGYSRFRTDPVEVEVPFS